MSLATTVSLTTVGYVMLWVQDMDRALSFYHTTLGIPVNFQDANWAELAVNGFALALRKSDHPKRESHPADSVIVFAVDDVKSTHAALKERGIDIKELHVVHEAGERVGVTANFHDPDGHSLSVFGYVPRAEWQG